jgi:hypothetical protein
MHLLKDIKYNIILHFAISKKIKGPKIVVSNKHAALQTLTKFEMNVTRLA